jgi:hypothetical protein
MTPQTREQRIAAEIIDALDNYLRKRNVSFVATANDLRDFKDDLIPVVAASLQDSTPVAAAVDAEWERNIHEQLDTLGAPRADVHGEIFSINGRFSFLRLRDSATAAPAPQAPEDGCICKGNWRSIVAESEPLFDSRFVDEHGKEYRFAGIVHAADDYYYLMQSKEGTRLLSCVGSIEGWGFQPAPLAQATECQSVPARAGDCGTYETFSGVKHQCHLANLHDNDGSGTDPLAEHECFCGLKFHVKVCEHGDFPNACEKCAAPAPPQPPRPGYEWVGKHRICTDGCDLQHSRDCAWNTGFAPSPARQQEAPAPDGLRFNFECGCAFTVYVADAKLKSGLSCCSMHEVGGQSVPNILKKCPMLLVQMGRLI